MNKALPTIQPDPGKLLFVGMGDRIKSDDGVGIYITEELQKYSEFRVIVAENSIENYLGKINTEKPETIIVIDAVDFGEKPGFYKLIPLHELANTITNTHNLSLKTIFSFLETHGKWILGIQPKQVSASLELSNNIKNISTEIIEKICRSYQINPKMPES